MSAEPEPAVKVLQGGRQRSSYAGRPEMRYAVAAIIVFAVIGLAAVLAALVAAFLALAGAL